MTGVIESCPQIDMNLLSRSLSASAAPTAIAATNADAVGSSRSALAVGQKQQKTAQEAVVVLSAEQLREHRLCNAEWLDQTVLKSSELG